MLSYSHPVDQRSPSFLAHRSQQADWLKWQYLTANLPDHPTDPLPHHRSSVVVGVQKSGQAELGKEWPGDKLEASPEERVSPLVARRGRNRPIERAD